MVLRNVSHPEPQGLRHLPGLRPLAQPYLLRPPVQKVEDLPELRAGEVGHDQDGLGGGGGRGGPSGAGRGRRGGRGAGAVRRGGGRGGEEAGLEQAEGGGLHVDNKKWKFCHGGQVSVWLNTLMEK